MQRVITQQRSKLIQRAITGQRSEQIEGNHRTKKKTDTERNHRTKWTDTVGNHRIKKWTDTQIIWQHGYLLKIWKVTATQVMLFIIQNWLLFLSEILILYTSTSKNSCSDWCDPVHIDPYLNHFFKTEIALLMWHFPLVPLAIHDKNPCNEICIKTRKKTEMSLSCKDDKFVKNPFTAVLSRQPCHPNCRHIEWWQFYPQVALV